MLKDSFSIIMMKPFMYLLLIVTICFSLVTSAEIPEIGEESKIVGGHEAKPNIHPYIVSLQTRFLSIRTHVCGGALVNKYFILTAAHCATESWLVQFLPMDAIAGIHNVNKFTYPAQVIEIRERTPHPLYKGGMGPHDIALYKTKTPFKFTKKIRPIQISSSFHSKASETSLKVVGWGALRSGYFIPDWPNNLQEVEVKPMSFSDCYNAIEDMKEIFESNPLNAYSNLCTGATASRVASCTGDSGGPLVQTNTIYYDAEENTEMYNASSYNCPNRTCYSGNLEHRHKKSEVETVLVGIVSWGVYPCGEPGAPSVYTNVAAYKGFIDYIINN